MRTSKLAFFALAASLILPGCFPRRADPGFFLVDSFEDLHDVVPGNGVCADTTPERRCTLRAAIEESNASPDANRIRVPAGVYVIDPRWTFPPTVRGPVVIEGDGRGRTTIFGRCQATGGPCVSGRVLDLREGLIQIADLSVALGSTGVFFGGADGAGGDGGAIRVGRDAQVVLERVDVQVSSTTLNGGTISNGGRLTLLTSVVGGSVATGSGGGIVNQPGATLTVRDSLIAGNSARFGGGIANLGTLVVESSTFTDNSASVQGGAILVSSSDEDAPAHASLNNVTIFRNTGGVFGSGPSANRVGGGLFVSGGFASATVSNSILGGNSSAMNFRDDCAFDNRTASPAIRSLGHNLFGQGRQCAGPKAGDAIGVDVGLGPETDTSGPTRTFAPWPTSPAVNGGHGATPREGLRPCTERDQRGRLRRDRCDIGAHERGA